MGKIQIKKPNNSNKNNKKKDKKIKNHTKKDENLGKT